MTVSATHEASAIATTASAALPPSARISAPASAVAGCPAATAGGTGQLSRRGPRRAAAPRAGSRATRSPRAASSTMNTRPKIASRGTEPKSRLSWENDLLSPRT